LKSRRQSR